MLCLIFRSSNCVAYSNLWFFSSFHSLRRSILVSLPALQFLFCFLTGPVFISRAPCHEWYSRHWPSLAYKSEAHMASRGPFNRQQTSLRATSNETLQVDLEFSERYQDHLWKWKTLQASRWRLKKLWFSKTYWVGSQVAFAWVESPSACLRGSSTFWQCLSPLLLFGRVCAHMYKGWVGWEGGKVAAYGPALNGSTFDSDIVLFRTGIGLFANKDLVLCAITWKIWPAEHRRVDVRRSQTA